jgi:hypothetical protein
MLLLLQPNGMHAPPPTRAAAGIILPKLVADSIAAIGLSPLTMQRAN